MNNVICSTSNSTVGCTFLDWSLHFLNGQDNYYRINENQWIPLVHNPLQSSGINAHKHKKNHPAGSSGTQELISNLKKHYNTQNLYSFFPFPKQIHTVCQECNIKTSDLIDSEKFNLVIQHQIDDYKNLINYCNKQGIPVVYVHADPKAVGYFWNRRNIGYTEFTGKKANSAQDFADEFQQVFFQDSINQWQDLNLTNIWDVRERRALDMRPYDTSKFWTVGFSEPSMQWINCMDLWHNTVDVVADIMKSLELSIVNKRLSAWLPIVLDWQRMQRNNLKFYNNLDYLVECIVKGWYYPLNDLTLDQEAIIQHCLIYRHNLNLMTWNLEKFPNNTIELHNLLEKNIHAVDNIY
jgi:hypothetical protein